MALPMSSGVVVVGGVAAAGGGEESNRSTAGCADGAVPCITASPWAGVSMNALRPNPFSGSHPPAAAAAGASWGG